MKSQQTKPALETERRQRFLKTLIREAILNVLAEQDVPPAGTQAPAPAPPLPSEAPPMEGEPAPEEGAQEFDVDNMIERLNVIRGGKSFTDPVVYGQLVTYFKGLDDTQKTNLQSFLMALGKIVINVQDQDQDAAASQNPAQPPAPPPAPPPAAPAPSTAPMAPPIAESRRTPVLIKRK